MLKYINIAVIFLNKNCKFYNLFPSIENDLVRLMYK